MDSVALTLLLLLGSLMLGGVPFGYILVKVFRGVDIRTMGSGNIGATNVMRNAGSALGYTCFALDAAKGLISVLVAQQASERGLTGALVPLGCAVLAVLGHMHSIFLRGKGGKGVATAAGALCGLAPVAIALGMAGWLLALLTLRWVSVASVLAAALVTVLVWVLPAEPGPEVLPRNVLVTLIAMLVVWKHRANLMRVARGTEPRALGAGRDAKPAQVEAERE